MQRGIRVNPDPSCDYLDLYLAVQYCVFRCLNGIYSGAAPLSMDSIQFLKSIGLIVSEIYGEP